MSSSSDRVTASDIRSLVASIEQLTLQVSDLVSRLDSVPVGTSAAAPVTDLGDWELVGEPALPFGFSSAEELSKLHLFRGSETGPPDTPGFLLDFACRELKGPSGLLSSCSSCLPCRFLVNHLRWDKYSLRALSPFWSSFQALDHPSLPLGFQACSC